MLKRLTLIVSMTTRGAMRNLRRLQQKIVAFGARARQTFKMVGVAAGLAFAFMGVKALVLGAKFEFVMRKIQAVTSATGEELVALTAKARELGRTTAFTATQAAEGMLNLAKAGLDVTTQLKSTIDVLHLAGGAGESMDVAAAALVATMKQFNLTAKDSTRVADVLTTLMDTTMFQSISDVADAMKLAGVAASTFGHSLEETAALAGMLRNLGLEGSMSGTQLRMAFAKLAAPTGRALEIITDLGLTVRNVNPTINKMSDILVTLGKSGATAGQVLQILGVRQMGLVNFTGNLNTRLEELIKIQEELEGSAGRAAKKYGLMMDTFQGAFKIAMSLAQEMQLSLFDVIKPEIRKGIEDLGRLFDAIGKSIRDNSAKIREFVGNVVDVVINVVKWVVANHKFLGQLVKIVAILGLMKIAAIALLGTLALILSPVGLIAGGIILFIKFRDEIVGAITKIVKAIFIFAESWLDATSEAREIVKKFFNFIISGFLFISKINLMVWNSIKGVIWKILDLIWTHTIKPWVDRVVGLFKWIGSVVGFVADAFTMAGKSAKAAGDVVGDGFTGKILDAFATSFGEDHLGKVGDFMGNVAGIIVKKGKEAIDKLSALGKNVAGVFAGDPLVVGAETKFKPVQKADLVGAEARRRVKELSNLNIEAAQQVTEALKFEISLQERMSLVSYNVKMAAADSYYSSITAMSKSFFSGERKNIQIMSVLTKQLWAGMAAAVLDSIAEQAGAESKMYAARALAAIGIGLLPPQFGGDPKGFAAAAKFGAAAAALGAVSALAAGGAAAVRERAAASLAAGTGKLTPLTEEERAAGVVRGAGGTGTGGRTFGSVTQAPPQTIVYSPSFSWTADNILFSEGGASAVEAQIDEWLRGKLQQMFDGNQIEVTSG